MKLIHAPPYIIFLNPPPHHTEALQTMKKPQPIVNKAILPSPSPSGINQFAMHQPDFDRLMAMRNTLDEFDCQTDMMSCEVEIIEQYIGTLAMHLSCARECIDNIHNIITA